MWIEPSAILAAKWAARVEQIARAKRRRRMRVILALSLLGLLLGASSAEALRCRLSCVGSLCKRVCYPATPEPDPLVGVSAPTATALRCTWRFIGGAWRCV